jgi:hypothetical protein
MEGFNPLSDLGKSQVTSTAMAALLAARSNRTETAFLPASITR